MNAKLRKKRLKPSSTELLMERISTLHKEERKLANETEEMKQQVASAKPINNDEEVDGGGGGLTLPLF
nr:agamous-like MADS-box protein AGL27 [Tanacetum cinerariifolium]